jgi:membrane-associated protease RseP (regulator of RpoE activity)
MLYWLRYFFTGQPLPFGGLDVSIHPVAWAGWGGMLITSLNLIPAGQLDGGHVLYVLLGRKRATKLLPVILALLVLLGFVEWLVAVGRGALLFRPGVCRAAG